MEYWMDPYPLIAMLSSFLYEVAQAKKKIITWKKIIELQYATSQEEHLPRTTPTFKPQKFGPILVSPLPPPLIRHFNQIAEQNCKKGWDPNRPTSQPI